jgi:hypothetical protein
MNTSRITEDLIVYAKSDRGVTYAHHVGTVDHLEGSEFIKLKRWDSPDHRHHWIPVSWVAKVEDHAVFLNKTSREFHQGLLNDCPVDDDKAA